MRSAEKRQTYLSFIDWLGLSLRLNSDPIDITGYQWREYTPTNVWGKRRVLWTNEGDRVLTLLSEPRSRIISSNAALLEVENEWLYHGLGPDGILDVLLKSCFFEILGISRLDLAVDFVPTEFQTQVIEGLASGEYYIGGKQNGSGFWSVPHNEKLNPVWNGRRIPHSTSWGHKTSAIKWKLYYKTKELLDAGGGQFMEKPYIVDHWRMHEFDISNVWRLEVSMHHLNDYKIYGNKIDLQELVDHRVDLFLSMYNSRFQVRKNEGHKDKSNDTAVTFLGLPDNWRNVTRAEPKKLAEHSGRITLLRHLVASLDDEHVLLDATTRRDVLEHIAKVIHRDRLDNYFRAMVGKWYEQWRDEVEAEVEQRYLHHEQHADELPHDNKGSMAAERPLDLPRKGVMPQFKPNTAFEDYNADGSPKPRVIDEQYFASLPIRPCQQYIFPLDRPQPPQFMQTLIQFDEIVKDV